MPIFKVYGSVCVRVRACACARVTSDLKKFCVTSAQCIHGPQVVRNTAVSFTCRQPKQHISNSPSAELCNLKVYFSCRLCLMSSCLCVMSKLFTALLMIEK